MTNVLLKKEIGDWLMQMAEDSDWSSSKGWGF